MLAGPMAGMRLGDLSADVIKAEPPRTGKFNRTHGYVVGYDPERIRRLVDAGAVGSVEGLE